MFDVNEKGIFRQLVENLLFKAGLFLTSSEPRANKLPHTEEGWACGEKWTCCDAYRRQNVDASLGGGVICEVSAGLLQLL